MNQAIRKPILWLAVAVVLASVVTFAVFAAVRSTADRPQTPDAETNTDAAETAAAVPDTGTEPVSVTDTITVAAAYRDDEYEQRALAASLDAFIAGFTAQHPEVAVNIVWSKAVPAEADGQVDMILCAASEIREYALSQTADLAALTAGREDLLASALSLGVVKDKQVFVPFTYDRAVIYADKAVFDAMGVSLPTQSWSYDDLERLLVKLSGSAGDERYIGLYMPYYMPFVWMTYVRGLGEGPVKNGKLTLSTGKNYAALSEMFTVLDYGYARSWKYAAYGSDNCTCAMSWTSAVHPERDGRYVTSDAEKAVNPGMNTDTLLATGRLVMLPVPHFDGKYAGSAISDETWGFMVTSSTAYKEAAEALITYALSEEGQRLLNAAYPGIPVNKTTWDRDFWRTGALGCPGSDSILVGIEQDGADHLCEIIKPSIRTYATDCVRVRTMAWLYFYNEIGGCSHSVKEYWKPYLQEFETWANKMTK